MPEVTNKKDVEIRCFVIPAGTYCFSSLFCCKKTPGISHSLCCRLFWSYSGTVTAPSKNHRRHFKRPVTLLLMEHSQLRFLYKYSWYWTLIAEWKKIPGLKMSSKPPVNNTTAVFFMKMSYLLCFTAYSAQLHLTPIRTWPRTSSRKVKRHFLEIKVCNRWGNLFSDVILPVPLLWGRSCIPSNLHPRLPKQCDQVHQTS